jgi:hypothetical protein
MKFKILGLIVKLLGFGVYVYGIGQCWVFLFCFCKLPILVIKKLLRITPILFLKISTLKEFGFWGLCLWFRSMLDVSHFSFENYQF